MHIKKKRLALLICSVLGMGFIAPPAVPVDSAFAASNDEIKFPIIDEYGDYKNGANYPNSYNVVKYDTFYEPTQIIPSKTTTVQEDGWVTGGPEYKDGYTVFASGEIRQIASVEKRQFGSAEIRQFESIEKSQS